MDGGLLDVSSQDKKNALTWSFNKNNNNNKKCINKMIEIQL